ncbi:glycoside hydrolase [Deinococcus yavapaiensis]|uniref:6-phospho-beta-glucosidase n=1 Tax=Deinococcus yavapaiensis KR-236 TaxID=694435 RepID=A0A318S4Y7_9DEIO|nr:glycoside hydrolase [Deinococcus yavapaiensis]PYE52763.1 6-phospho-beta-glucosidase [Deinococcus yavapaiensis KR-236]
MARLRIVYVGGGSTRAPGTVASFIRQWENFAGSEIVLVDVHEEHLDLVRRLAAKMADVAGADLTVTATSRREEALVGADVVLSSYRPGGFEARVLDERIPLRHGVIGQETQGPGGFFMALRAIHVARQLVEDMSRLCPNAVLFNYTNPVNVVAQAVRDFSDVRVISLCEGPIIFPRQLAGMAGLDPNRVRASMIGLNHACWSDASTGGAMYGDEDLWPHVEAALASGRVTDAWATRLLDLALVMRSVPAAYMRYYYFRREVLAELRTAPTTRAEDILAATSDYWTHYRELLDAPHPVLDPKRSRGGIYELEIAVDVMDAMYNDRAEVWPCNVVNGGALRDLPADLVVEGPCVVDRDGPRLLSGFRLPEGARGLVGALGEYQRLAAHAAWNGSRTDAIRALSANPIVPGLSVARALYDDLAAAQRAWLPERLW